MSPARPLVSVLLASRDGARYLEESLASLAAQTYPEVEVVLVDDGSRDTTPEILARYAASRPRVRVLSTPGIGLAGALAVSAGAASGELLARQDDDDRSHPERLARQVEFLGARPEIGVLGTFAEMIDADGSRSGSFRPPLHGAAMRRMLRQAPPFVHGSVMMRRETYDRAGGYRAAFRAAQDLDLWMRLQPETGLANLPEELYAWRLHPAGVFSRARDDQLFYAAVARAFRDERVATGRDSVERLAACETPAAFLAAYQRAARLARYLGESYVREGRPGDARRLLARAWSDPGEFVAALGWWLLSWPAGLTPRARQAPHAASPSAIAPGAAGPRR